MNNVIYREVIRRFDHEKDCESAPECFVTKEANGYAVFVVSDQGGRELLEYVQFGINSNTSKVNAIRLAINYIDANRKESQ